MGPETVATLIVVAVIVLLIAYHLIAIALGLKTVIGALDVIADALVGIKKQTDPVNRVVGGIAGEVLAIDDDLEGLLELVGAALAAKAAGKPSPHKTPPPAKVATGAGVRPRAAAGSSSKMAAAVARARGGR
ncbi:MAG: hypothetical protein QOD63_568 [Actinomycetota bacterium]|jgi:hypothetical protein|nr:hypothetical protein [Actinomycetota bacterium]